MRFLFVIDSFGSGGAQRQMTALSAGLTRRGHIVEYFIYHPFLHRHFQPEGLVVHAFPKSSRWSLGPILALRKLFRKGRFDAVLSYLGTPNFYAEVARMGRKTPPLVVSERSAFPEGKLLWGTRLRQEIHRLADHIVVNSHHQRERMIREFPWMADRISTIENGVDGEAFGVAPVSRYPEAEEKRFTLLAVGRVDKGKNPLVLIEAMVLAKAAGHIVPHVRWAGRPDLSPSGRAYQAKVEKRLEESGLSENWEWLGERGDIPALLRECDALVHPSLFEGFPNALAEAMAAGRPVLAGAIGDHARIVQPGINGFLFDPNSAAHLAEVLNIFQALSLGERDAMGRYAAVFVRENLSMDRCVDRYEALLTQLGR
jgi:glycosyltransferase involved in cell wall biosynthesis